LGLILLSFLNNIATELELIDIIEILLKDKTLKVDECNQNKSTALHIGMRIKKIY
jgi:hypothetical protein